MSVPVSAYRRRRRVNSEVRCKHCTLYLSIVDSSRYWLTTEMVGEAGLQLWVGALPDVYADGVCQLILASLITFPLALQRILQSAKRRQILQTQSLPVSPILNLSKHSKGEKERRVRLGQQATCRAAYGGRRKDQGGQNGWENHTCELPPGDRSLRRGYPHPLDLWP